MLDFLTISTKTPKKGFLDIYPKFIVGRKKDLMIRGSDFYAVWNEELGLWSQDEDVAFQLIDKELDNYAKEHKDKFDGVVNIQYMWDSDSGMVDKWHRYVQKQMPDNYHNLDEKLIFANTETSKKDYASKRLQYPLEKGDMSAYEELMSTLYHPEERAKLEWAIGSIVSGDSKKIQKFIVMYGSAGTGKSTVLNIVQDLFDGYYSVFDAKALGSANNSFALEAFNSNPLVAIQHDGDLSRIEDNTRLNSVVSHELMTVNEKFKSTYASRFNCFLFMGTNKPVKITDAKSGLLRRLIDVAPSGNRVSVTKYKKLTSQIKFELGAIAEHCLEVYQSNPGMYDDYVPKTMLGASNDFYNFVLDSYDIFKEQDGVSLRSAWEMYKQFCEEAKVPYPYSQRLFKEELKNYFEKFEERVRLEDDTRVRNYFSGFLTKKFEYESDSDLDDWTSDISLKIDQAVSIFDRECASYPAQYASEKGTPLKKWSEVDTKLSDLDTSQLHYVKVPKNHIVIDFDIRDESGEKSYEKNLEAASKWPTTYAELSKSGQGIHLHYIYDGDVSKLSRVYGENIEVKVFTGNSSLRRKLTLCNDKPISTINSGLPLKGEAKVINTEAVKSEKGLRALIIRNLKKEIHPGTKPSIDFICKILQDAYDSGMKYDITDMRPDILAFAANSTHQADYCIKLVNKMQFKSEEPSTPEKPKDDILVFFDVEVFSNLFVVVFKAAGKPAVKMINPKPEDIENLLKFKLIGFNCRRYDNHILYARLMGYSNLQLYNLSQRIIEGSRNAFFGEAYNLSYTDVYDFCSKKQSLKKWEIELGIHHQELGLKWDEPAPEEMWDLVAEYCINDVVATEAVFNARQADWTARQILADVAGMSVNDTTNSLTTKIIFGNNRKPQDAFNYRFMGDESQAVSSYEPVPWSVGYDILDPEYYQFDENNRPIFPGYTFDHGVSTYRGEEVGEGGYVYSEPGIYWNVALLDISSMHPSSIVAEKLFGDEYTERFNDILQARIAIKHKEFDRAKKMMDGKLSKYLDDEKKAKDLAQALKIAINSVYGLTSAKFENPFRDKRNIDNIVAKRGALFMVNLKHEVQKRGFIVAHIKTDSIKIPNATPEIISFVMDYGKAYGYNFEHEATYDRMCLVNDAVYIAKYENGDWTATGTQFQVPYVFKTLFSHEPIEFKDLCETKTVSSALYLDMNEGLGEDEHDYHFVGKAGLFCPMLPGSGGGILLREKDGKYYAATGTKGYRWMESEMVDVLNKKDQIDMSYYVTFVDEAVASISEYGDFEAFVSDGFEEHVNAPMTK